MWRFVRFALVALAFFPLAPARPALASATGRVVCTVTDHRVIGLSGLVVTGTGFIAISDSNVDKSAIRVWFLDRRCRPVRSIGYPTPAFDPEDVAVGRDGTIYVADIGDNAAERSSIAVWRIRPGSSTPRIYRYRYPDGPHDAEAMLRSGDDTPIFVTKEIGGGDIYVPAGPADPSGAPVRLRRAGTFRPVASGTPNPFGAIGASVVTGGANARDRTEVALRTYADAYVWHVTGGDVVAAITTGTPRVVPLPDEPQGESIAFDPIGSRLYTVSDSETVPVRTPILEYALPPAGPASPVPSASGAHHASTTRPDGPVRTIAIAAIVVGAALVVIAVVVRRRRRAGGPR